MSLILLILAIENLADMLTGRLEFLEWARELLDKVPILGKIGRCKYCLSFWLYGLTLCMAVPPWLIMWLGVHRIVVLASEFFDRYLNRAPFTIMNLTDSTKP